jgi:subtilisin family serine protease
MPLAKTACASFQVDDPLYKDQWNLHRIKAEAAWSIATGDGVKVIVLDEGCDLGHPDLRAQFLTQGINLGTMAPPGACNPGVSHGTACAGIVGASINNQLGIAGLAGECELIPVAIVRGSTSEIKDAIEYALDQKAVVLSFSHDDPKWETDELNEEIAQAAKQLVICAAAGNGTAQSLSYPAKHPDVIACGAVNRDPRGNDDERRRPSSNCGDGLSVVAPGEDILTTFNRNDGKLGPKNEYGYLSGTSAATPHVAGLAALLISAYKRHLRPNPQEVRRIIQESAEELPWYSYKDMTKDPHGKKGWDFETGFGLINVKRAFAQADSEFGTPSSYS